MIASRVSAPRSLQDILAQSHGVNGTLDASRVASLAKIARDFPRQSADHDGLSAPFPNEEVMNSSHLLISPLLPPVAGLLSMSSENSLFSTKLPSYKDLTKTSTLAIWGQKDQFTSAKRLVKWATALSDAQRQAPEFEWHEVAGADHFWRTEVSKVPSPVPHSEANCSFERQIKCKDAAKP